MSRRLNAAQDRAAQNQTTIKGLLKLEGNKFCSDCKRNKHPRWASWNLGIFICIRCSGIHRSMGTHISRVKSVDLDSWTDEQLASVVRWGNTRANKYWEAKLAPGHVPSDAKIENFIRTKYETKRWVAEGGIPDPATLGGDDEDVPLSVVQRNVQVERSSSLRQPPAFSAAPQPNNSAFDLIGAVDEPAAPPQRPSTTGPSKQSAFAAPPRAQPSQLLGNFDFLGSTIDRPASAAGKTQGNGLSRPDLKQSILSLYASAPKSAVPPTNTGSLDLFGDSVSASQPPASNTTKPSTNSLINDFSNLDFGAPKASVAAPTPKPATPAAPKPQPANPASYSAFTSTKPSSFSSSGGGGFFDTSPASQPAKPATTKPSAAPPPLTMHSSSLNDDFGDFSSALGPASASTAGGPMSGNGLLDFSSTKPLETAAKSPIHTKPTQTNTSNSVFNLNAKQPPAPANYAGIPQTSAPSTQTSFPGMADPWGSNDWNTPDPVPAPTTTTSTALPTGTSVQPSLAKPTTSTTTTSYGWSGPTTSTTDASDPWGAPSPPMSKPAPATTSNWTLPSTLTLDNKGSIGGFGASNPFTSSNAPASTTPSNAKLAPEDDFGDWGSAPALPTPAPQASSSSGARTGGFANEDLFSNAWE